MKEIIFVALGISAIVMFFWFLIEDTKVKSN